MSTITIIVRLNFPTAITCHEIDWDQFAERRFIDINIIVNISKIIKLLNI